MPKSWRTRKRGTVKQMGKPFPIIQKKLPAKISINYAGGKYKPKYKWLERDKESASAVEHLVAHAGFTESESRLKGFIRDSGAKDVDAVFAKLLIKGIIKEIPSKSETWKYEVPVVTGAGRRNLHGTVYGELTPKEKAQMRKLKKEGLL